jgi:hypothetical protein
MSPFLQSFCHFSDCVAIFVPISQHALDSRYTEVFADVWKFKIVKRLASCSMTRATCTFMTGVQFNEDAPA